MVAGWPPHFSIISSPSDIVKAFATGAADYVTKPFNASELLARVQAHLELKNGRDVIQQKSGEMREMLHVLCHDLASPFANVLGVLQVLEDNPEGFAEYSELLKKSARNGTEVIDLVRQMRAVEEKPLELRPINLLHAVEESLLLLQQRFDSKELSVNKAIDAAIEVQAEKTSLINSVLNNILTNAVKFSFQGGTIEISATATASGATLSFKDSGIGMPAALLADLFDISKATSRPGTDGEKGTGFGMPLIRKFMHTYGGEIKVESREKKQSPAEHGKTVVLEFENAVAKLE